jgi:hypothetical protein
VTLLPDGLQSDCDPEASSLIAFEVDRQKGYIVLLAFTLGIL